MPNDQFDAYLGEINRRCSTLEAKLDKMMDNDLAHLKQDINQINVKITETQTDVEWLKRSFWVLVGPVVGALAVGVLNLLMK